MRCSDKLSAMYFLIIRLFGWVPFHWNRSHLYLLITLNLWLFENDQNARMSWTAPEMQILHSKQSNWLHGVCLKKGGKKTKFMFKTKTLDCSHLKAQVLFFLTAAPRMNKAPIKLILSVILWNKFSRCKLVPPAATHTRTTVSVSVYVLFSLAFMFSVTRHWVSERVAEL